MEGKQNNKKKLILISAISLVSLAAVIALTLLFIELFGVDTSVVEPTEPATTVETEETTTEPEPTDLTTPDGELYDNYQDWDELKGINEEIVGWIDIPHTAVNYPVLFHEGDSLDSQYYLHRNYDKTNLYAGSIFLDFRCVEREDSQHVILHGHNMASGAMFADLLDYGKWSPVLEQYKKAPTLFFNTPEATEQWIIFAVYKTNTLDEHGEFFNYLMGDFSTDAQFMNYVYNVKERSFFDVPVPINEDDRIISLSTCSYEFTEFRTVAVARRVRPGESVIQYVKDATVNEDAVWPQVYYNNFGGTRPTITTFKTELAMGNIDWYDGDKSNLSGNEWLPATSKTQNFYVTFVNYDGTIIETQVVKKGHDAVAPADPVKPSNSKYDYVFKGWKLDFTNVDSNMVVAPEFEAVKKG